MSRGARAAIGAWLITAMYYFYQYTLRSAPAVMMPQLSEAFGLGVIGTASLAGLFYYGYSPFSLVAGAAMDRLGPRRVVPLGAAIVGVGALLFASGSREAASIGRFLQGAGGVFALVGAAYIATTNFPASRAATLIGATQMFGMAGGSAGQFLVGPLIAAGITWTAFWAGMGILGLAISALLFFLLPESPPAARREDWLQEAAAAFGVVVRNPQSILCGMIAGWLFIPTTIFDMVWGVRYLQEARGVDYATAVLRSATVPLGWIIGSPLFGFISDRKGSQPAGCQRHRDRRRQLPQLHVQRAARAGVRMAPDRGQRRRVADDPRALPDSVSAALVRRRPGDRPHAVPEGDRIRGGRSIEAFALRREGRDRKGVMNRRNVARSGRRAKGTS